MKHVFFGAKRYIPVLDPPFVDTGLRRLFSYWDNEAIDDVTEKFARQFVVANVVPSQVTGRMLNSVGTADAFADSESYYLPASQPFSIQGKANLTAMPVANNPAQLVGVYDLAVIGNRSWAVWVISNGQLRFVISNNGGTNATTIDTPSATISPNVPFHFAVERDAANNVVIYIDGVEKASKLISIGSTRMFERLATRKELKGAVWDIAIANKVIFGQAFTPPGKFTKANNTPTYPADVAADIVAQFGFRRDDPHNEVTGKPFAFTGGAGLLWGNLRTNAATGDTFSTDIDYFGAGNFTYEFKFRITAMPSVMTTLLGHYGAGGADADRNMFAVLPDGRLMVAFNPNSVFGPFSTPVSTIAANTFYHVVVERIGTMTRLYINGAIKATATLTGPLALTGGNKLFIPTGGSMTRYIWDIRIAKRAMYNGVVVEPAVLPKMPVDYKKAIPSHTVRVGSSETANGVMRGFAKNFLYVNTSLSFGELYPQVYWNTTQNRMVRIKAICSQGAGLIVMCYAPSNEPRQANTPIMTNLLKIGSETFDMTTAQQAAKQNGNDICTYASSTLHLTWPTDEALKTIEFV